MTVCIAGISGGREEEQALILCTDTRVTISGFASSDSATKLALAGSLTVLFADNASRAKELIAVIESHVQIKEIADESQIIVKLKQAARIHKRNLLEEYCGLTWGIDYDSYLNGALNHLPAETLSRISNEIEQLHFECQLIVASHTKTGYRIFTIDSKGTVLQADGYAVIGSGSWIAQASLCQRQYSQNFTMPTAAYVIYEAKKLAENEPTVGKRTAMWVTHHRHGVIGLMDGSLLLPSEDARSATRGPDLLGSWFNLYGPQQIPNLEFPAGAIKWHPYDLPKGASLKKDEEETISRGSVLNFV